MVNRRVVNAILLLMVLLFNCRQALYAQVADAQAVMTADTLDVTVGDLITVQLVVTHEPGTQVVIPQLEPIWGDFEVRSQSAIETERHADGSQTTRQIFALSLFATGLFQTPALPVTIYHTDGPMLELSAAPVEINVRSVLAVGDEALRDIKAQADLPIPPLWPWIAASTLPILLLVGSFVWWLYRRIRSSLSQKDVDQRTAAQVAYEELSRIEKLDYLVTTRHQEYYGLVTDCLRYYLDYQHDIPAIDRTTTELKEMLTQSNLDPGHVHDLGILFAESDLVKFAKVAPEPELAQDLIPHVRVLIEEMEQVQEVEKEK